MDFDELKKAWQSQSARIERLEEQNMELQRCVRENKLSSRRSKLLRTYTVLLIVSVVMIPFISVSFPLALDTPLSITLMFDVTLGFLAIANGYVYYLISRIDITAFSVRETLSRVLYMQRTRQLLRYISMAWTFVVVVIFFRFLWDIDSVTPLVGAAVGGIIGAVIGLRKESQIKATIREMKAILEDAVSDD